MTKPLLYLLLLGVGIVTGCVPLAPLAQGSPPSASSVQHTPTVPIVDDEPVWEEMNVVQTKSASPNGTWLATELVATRKEGAGQYYTELQISKADGTDAWTAVADWRYSGLGAATLKVLQWTSDEQYLYFTNAPTPDGCALFMNASDLQRINLTTSTVEEILPVGTTPSLDVAPSGTVAYIQARELHLFSPDTGEHRVFEPTVLEPDTTWGNLFWSPTGHQLAFVVAYHPCQSPEWSHSVVLLDLETGMEHVVLDKDNRRVWITGWLNEDQLALRALDQIEWVLDLSDGAVHAVDNAQSP